MDTGLIAVLKSIASQERALATLASAEAARLEALAAGLQAGTLPAYTGKAGQLEKSAQTVLHSAATMQLLLQSKLAELSSALQIPTIAGNTGTNMQYVLLTACGQGVITRDKDAYCGGCGTIKSLQIEIRDSLVIQGDICYQVEKKRSRLFITALPGTICVNFPAARSTLISGRALIKKNGSTKMRDKGCFTLTLINSEDDIIGHKFHIVIKADSKLALNHDSGLSSLNGVIKAKYTDTSR